MPSLTLEQLIQGDATARTAITHVDVPEWGGSVALRRITAAELMTLRGDEQADDLESTCRFLAIAICDDAGKRLCGEDGAKKLAEMAAGPLFRVAEAAREWNGLSTKANEARVKN